MNTMDPFEVRMQFLSLLRKLNATQQSIQKVVSYALKYFLRCGEDLWDCIVEECQKGTVNHRINVLYFLDSLCEAAAVARVHALESSGGAGNMGGGGAGSAAGAGASKQYMSFYVDFVARDLEKIVEYVVPQGRQGLPNFTSTKQILESWRSKRVIDPQKVDDAMAILAARQSSLDDPSSSTSASVAVSASLSRNDIFKRIEEDRERHKRLRERRWVQPALPSAFPPFAAASATSDMGTSGAGTPTPGGGSINAGVPSAIMGLGISSASSGSGGAASAHNPGPSWNPNPAAAANHLASFLPLPVPRPTFSPASNANADNALPPPLPTPANHAPPPPIDYAVSLTDEHNLALDIEFENEWDATSDWNEDDEEAAGEELELVRRGRGVGGAAGEEDGQRRGQRPGDKESDRGERAGRVREWQRRGVGGVGVKIGEDEGGEEPMDLS